MTVLSTSERAFAVAAVRALGQRAEALCGRRSSALRRQAALLCRDPQLLRDEARALDRPQPLGLAEIHRSWYTLPPPVDANLPAAELAKRRAYLSRRLLGHLVDMSTGPDALRGQIFDRLEREDPIRLAELVSHMGQRRVAVAFSGAPRAALAQLCARLGEPAASELLVRVRAATTQIGSEEVKSAQRAMFQLGAPSVAPGSPMDVVGPDETNPARALFLRAGAGWLGPALVAGGGSSGDRLRRIAQRLPREIGEILVVGARRAATEAECAAAIAAAAVALAS